MDREVALVVRGFLRLTSAQRSEFVDYVNAYNQGTAADQDRITRESVLKSAQRMDVGPTSSGFCPCCGK
jgi:hypothetical protein